MNILGIEATSSCIRGRKSNGSEDLSSSYKHWRKIPNSTSNESIN